MEPNRGPSNLEGKNCQINSTQRRHSEERKRYFLKLKKMQRMKQNSPGFEQYLFSNKNFESQGGLKGG